MRSPDVPHLIRTRLEIQTTRHRGNNRRYANRRRRAGRWLLFEPLEQRRLLAVDFSGVPAWDEQGPGPIDVGGAVDEQVGMIHGIAVKPGDPDTVFVATGNGGVWRSLDASSADPTWEPLTDQQQALSMAEVAFDPNDVAGQTWYAGFGRRSNGFGDGVANPGGLLRTTDNGDTWSLVGTNHFAGSTVTGIAPTTVNDPTSGQQVVLVAAQSGDNGIFRSVDGGNTFDLTSGTTATTDGIDNDGDSMTDEAGELNLPTGNATALVADPGNANRFYTAIPGIGVFRTDNAGGSWQLVNGTGGNVITGLAPTGMNPTATNIRILLAVHSNAGVDVVYAGIIRNNQTITGGDNHDTAKRLVAVFRSTDQGTNWRQVQNIPTNMGVPNVHPNSMAGNNAYLTAHPTDPNVVFVGGAATPRFRVAMDDNNPANDDWSDNYANSNGTSPHADPRELVFPDTTTDFAYESSDGGIYRLVDPDTPGTRVWESMMGDIRPTEFYSVSYDPLNDTVFGGTQDNGSPFQKDTGDPDYPLVWESASGCDGGGTAIDVTTLPGFAIHYTSSQNFDACGGLVQRVYDGSNMEIVSDSRDLTVIGTGGTTLTTKDGNGNYSFDPTLPFMVPYVLNNVSPLRMVMGTAYLYESTDAGETLTSLGGVMDTGGGVYVATNPVGSVNPTGAPLVKPIAYGGWSGGVKNEDVLWVGALQGKDGIDNDTDGNTDESDERTPTLLLRTSGTGLPSVVSNYTAAPVNGGAVTDIVMDPEDWHTAYLVDVNGSVFRAVTNDAGTSVEFTNLTGNLGTFTTGLRTIEFARVDGKVVLLVGGVGGVYRTINPDANPVWTKLGANLPNGLVNELSYTPPVDPLSPLNGDVLLVGIYGRGAWTIDDASLVLDEPPVLTVCGDEDYVNQDDEIRLVRNMANPLLVDVYLNSVLELSMPLAGFEQINVFGVGGNDELIVDTSYGLINVTKGIRFDGDGACFIEGAGHADDAGFDRGFDTLTITSDFPDVVYTSEEVAVGQLPGSGRHTLEGTENGVDATQTVWFEELEPVNTIVAATDFLVASISGLASLLQEANTINFDDGGQLVLDAGVVDDDGAPNPSAGSLEGDDSLSDQDDFYNGLRLRFTSGALTGEEQEIADYNGDDRLFTFSSSFSAAPVDGDAFEILVDGSRITVDSFEPISFTNKENVTVDAGAGDDRFFASSEALSYGLTTLTVNGQDGNDTVTFVDLPVAGAVGLSGVTVNGGEGDDIVDAAEVTDDAPLVLNGDDGRDFLRGGAGDDTLLGGPGDDILSGGDPAITGDIGDNQYDGGDGFDTLVVLGTLDDDVIDVFQPPPSALLDGDYALTAMVNGNTDSATIVQDSSGFPGQAPQLPTVEEVHIEAGAGNDLIRVGHSDAFADASSTNGIASQTVRFAVTGDAPNASDRLIVRDDGTGDLVLVRQAPDGRSGRVNVAPAVGGGLADVVYEGIERLDVLPIDPVSGGSGDSGDGRVVVFQADPFELNDNRLIPTEISDTTATPLNPTIDPGGISNPFGDGDDVPGDEDWYQFLAPKIGTFQFEVVYDRVSTVPSGRAGLPDNGDIGIGVYDGAGNLIVWGRADDLYTPSNATNVRVRATFSAAAGEFYYLRVRGGSEAEVEVQSINTYQATIQEVDLLGPQIFDPDGAGPIQAIQVVTAGVADEEFDLFDVKPSNNGPTPAVDGLKINLRDLLMNDPDLFHRAPGDVYPALDALIAALPSHYAVVGDAVGSVAIDSVSVMNNSPTIAGTVDAVGGANQFTDAGLVGLPMPPEAGDLVIFHDGPAAGQIRPIDSIPVAGTLNFGGDPFLSAPAVGNSFTVLKIATAMVTLNFASPLPDDRYTLVVYDGVRDPAGNRLDGESNAVQPVGDPVFPSGDGWSGGDFVVRFTVDSRPEIGTVAAGNLYVDINGNLVFDPESKDNDATNRDLVFQFGLVADAHFTGNFAPGGAVTASGFDKLGAYGVVGNVYRFLLDFDHDGTVDFSSVSEVAVAGFPVAGEFNLAHPGDEIGLFNGRKWYLDTDGDNVLEVADTTIPTPMRGLPIVGDFNGDGADDLATYDPGSDTFFFDLDLNGSIDDTLVFGFNGFGERPLSGDINLDGIDDLVLWVTNRAGLLPDEAAEWYMLVSDNPPGLPSSVFEPFSPEPLGNDLFAQFGNDDALPLFANLDPPVSPGGGSGEVYDGAWAYMNFANPLDVDASGFVTPLDVLLTIDELNENGSRALPLVRPAVDGRPIFFDATGDNQLTPEDLLVIISDLNRTVALLGNGEGEAHSEPSSPVAFDAQRSRLAMPVGDGATFASGAEWAGVASAWSDSGGIDQGQTNVPSYREGGGQSPASVQGDGEGPMTRTHLDERHDEDLRFATEDLDDVLDELSADVALAWQTAG